MTFEECQQTIAQIRQRQGTTQPLIRVDFGGTVYRGRLTRADSDRTVMTAQDAPFGLLVLDDPGLGHGQQTILQIASIKSGGIHDPIGVCQRD